MEALVNPLKSIKPVAEAESQETQKKPWWSHKHGQVLPLVAIALPVLVGMTGVSLTVGTLYFAQAKLQNAVDAAALAGAQEMTTADATAPGDQARLITQDDAAATNPTGSRTNHPREYRLGKSDRHRAWDVCCAVWV
ncbi:MAG: pilus assembly protein TadG-related protein, partial [Sulfobacillus sp.]